MVEFFFGTNISLILRVLLDKRAPNVGEYLPNYLPFRKTWNLQRTNNQPGSINDMEITEKIRQVLYFMSSWIFLNVFMNFNFPAPLPSPFHLLLPSLEVWVVLLFLSLLVRFAVPLKPYISIALILLFIMMRLFRIGDVLMPYYLNRPFNLYMDTDYLPDLLHLLYHSLSLPILFLWGTIFLGLLIFSFWAISLCLRHLYISFSYPRLRQSFWAITIAQTLLVGSYVSNNYPSFLPPPGTSISLRLVAEARFISNIRQIKSTGLAAVQLSVDQAPHFPAPFKELKSVDVHLFLIESYGHTLFSNPLHTESFGQTAEKFSTAMQKAGFDMVTHCLRSPTFGGTSWLSFGTLETGVWVDNQIHYNFLVNSEVQPLASYFNRAGYRTVSVMPGVTLPWPEGSFFSYETNYYAKDFGYRGPAFGWSPMPDQFVLKKIYQKEILPRKKPLFVRYVMISSHAPFHLQPPYINDWETIGDGEVYHQLDPVTYPVNWPDLSNAAEAYLRSISYEFEVLAEYLSSYLEKDSLVIIMGDHQPNAQLTEDNPTWLVPVHILSSNHELLEPFKRLGYKEGMTPNNPPPFPKMDTFLYDFLSAFSR